MNSPLTRDLSKWGALLSLSGTLLVSSASPADADAPQPAPNTKQTPAAPTAEDKNAAALRAIHAATFPEAKASDAPRLLAAFRGQNAYKLPLDLKADGLSVEEVVERVKTNLLARKPAVDINIEVRDVLPVELSIGVKGSTVGRVLGSTAKLAGAELYVFSDHALIAPHKSLTPEEQADLTNGNGSWWASGLVNGGRKEFRQQAFSSFITEEISRASKNKATTVGQLSPDSQAMLQQLVDEMNSKFASRNTTRNLSTLTLTSNSRTEIDSQNRGHLVLNFTTPGNMMSWSLDGRSTMMGVSFNAPNKPSTTPTKPRLPLDLSAGKS